MQADKARKNKKWIWVIAGVLLAAVAIAGVLLAIFIQPAEQPSEAPEEKITSDLYWNVDRLAYTENSEAGLSNREPGEDGLYRIRFAVDGTQVELPVADKQLVNYIDTMDLMGLLLDANGTIIDAMEPKSVAVEMAKNFYVQEADNGSLKINSSMLMNGFEMIIPVTEKLKVLNVDPAAEMVGQLDRCQLMDEVLVYGNEKQEATHVFIVKRAVDAEVYHLVGSNYNTTAGKTTRTPDENGVYTLTFAYKGEQVELKCRDVQLVNSLDALCTNSYTRDAGLLFDEEGYIVDYINANIALKGKQICKGYNIMQIVDGVYQAERLLTGKELGMQGTFTLAENCDIFMDENGCGYFIGERTELQVGDRFYGYTNFDGELILAFVTRRMVDSPMYYNFSSQYSTATGATTRTPDEKGYYVFQMATHDGTVTLKTKDKALASEVDRLSVMGLKVEGNIIKGVVHRNCVCGNTALRTGSFVNSVSGSVINLISADEFKNGEMGVGGILAADVQITDVTGANGEECGKPTTLQVGDLVNAYLNVRGEVSHILVLGRYAKGTKIYYNISRQYDSATASTTRTPDAEGYYVFDMICEGKAVTVKTKSKTMATYIDSFNAPIGALKVNSSGIVQKAYPAASAVEFGERVSNRYYVTNVSKNGKTYDTYRISNGEKIPGTTTWTLAKNCVVYNVSTGYVTRRGEKTTLKNDDRIVAITDRSSGSEIAAVFVISRKVDSPLYWHVKRMYSSANKETTRVPDEEGYYVFDLAVNGQIKQFKTKDKAVASAVDAKTYAEAFGLALDGDIILQAYSWSTVEGLSSSPGGHRDVTKIDGRKVTVVKNTPGTSNFGSEMELTFSKNCKVYDVSRYADPIGGKAEVGLGDRLRCYANADGEVVYCFIVNKNTHTAGHISRCEHCGEDVRWVPYEGTIYSADGHYYLTHDYKSGQKTVGSDTDATKNFDVVIDLNGKTLNSSSRGALVYGTLSIVDTVGGGSLVAAGIDGNGGNIFVQKGGTLNLYSGTLTVAQGETAAAKSGGVVRITGAESTFNMYGGAIVGGTASVNGGNLYISSATFNLYGGSISGGSAAVEGGNVYATSSAVLNIRGGSISGDVYVDAGVKVNLSGAPQITVGPGTGMKLAEGAKLTLGELTQEAAFVVSASGAFTEENENIQAYAGYFKPVVDGHQILVKDNALCYIRPVQDPNQINNAPLSFAAGTNRAVCPLCDEWVTWTALTEMAETTYLEDGGHYYLAQSIVYEGSDEVSLRVDAKKSACLHLNGNDLTSKGARIFSEGTLNIMGSGNVSGSYNKSQRGATLEMNNASAVINLYGGTYTSFESSYAVAMIRGNGGSLNIYADAVIGSTESAGRSVRVYYGTCSQYGGKIVSGSGNAVTLSNYSETKSGSFRLYGGQVIAVSGYAITIGGSATAPAVLEISGGTVTGTINATINGTVTLSGAPILTDLRIAEGHKIVLGQLTKGAAVKVTAGGVFTKPNEKAADYVAYFTAADPQSKVTVQENALCIEKDYNKNLQFAEGTTNAVCPVCGVEVTWTALTEATGTTYLNNGHYYLAQSIVYEGSDEVSLRVDANKTGCLHLNGNDFTSKGARIFSEGTLNIMGNGNVSGSYNKSQRGATLEMNNASAVINLYGGTYTSFESGYATAMIRGNGGSLNIYADAVIGSAESAGRSVRVYYGTCSQYGGKIVSGSGNAVTLSNYSTAKSGSFRLYGGQVIAGSGYAITTGGSATAPAVLEISGGTVTGTINATAKGAVTLSGAPILTDLRIAEDAKIILGELTEGAAITVAASGMFTQTNEKAAEYAEYFTPLDEAMMIIAKENALYCEQK